MFSARLPLILVAIALPLGTNLAAKDSLGVFSSWAAFRDPSVPRCYAIARPLSREDEKDAAPYASIGTWPENGVRNQLYLRLSRPAARGARISLRVGNRNFVLRGNGNNAWARNAAMDAAIVAAMRVANTMAVRSTISTGRQFTDSYALAGAATAIDAATLACARMAR